MQPLERHCQRFWVAREFSGCRVRDVLSRTRHRHLHQRRHNRCDKRHQQTSTSRRLFVIVGRPHSKQGRELNRVSRITHDRAEHRRDCGDQDVSVLNVSNLVSDHATQFSRTQQTQDPLSHRHHAMLRIPSRRKSIRVCLRNHADARLRDIRCGGQLRDHSMQLGSLLFRDFLSSVHRQNQPIREVVRPDIHRQSQSHEDHQGIPPHRPAKPNHQRTQPTEKQHRLDLVPHDPLLTDCICFIDVRPSRIRSANNTQHVEIQQIESVALTIRLT